MNEISLEAQEHSIPLFYIQSIGFYSSFSIQLPSRFPIVDTHPDPASTQDIRLLEPWPDLLAFQEQQTKDIENLDDHKHDHLPYIIILLHYLNEWRKTHEDKPPLNYGQKKEFKALVESGARTSNAEGAEENFAEAAAAVLKSLNPSLVPAGLRQVFEDSACRYDNSDSNFWVIAAAIRDFSHAHNGQLPLPGAIPDMKAQSADYIHLQNIYKRKARADLAEVVSLIRKNRPATGTPIPESEVEAFCKNAAHVKLIRGSPIPISRQLGQQTSIHLEPDQKKQYLQLLQLDMDAVFPLYLAFQVYDFAQGSLVNDFSSSPSLPTLETLQKVANKLAADLITKPTQTPTRAQQASLDSSAEVPSTQDPIVIDTDADLDDSSSSTTELKTTLAAILTEMHRAGGGELHNISALTGGIVAQEVIKVITKQYIPVDNVCVFDGVRSRSAVFKI